MFGNIGAGELLLIFVVVLLVFGAKRLPEIARGLGQGIREFKQATRSISSELTMEASYQSPVARPPLQGAPAARTENVVPQSAPVTAPVQPPAAE